MRAAEGIQIFVFLYFGLLAWWRPLPRNRRLKVTKIAAVGLGSTIAAACVLPGLMPPLASSVARDWLPAALMLIVYWQAGEFFVRVDTAFQDRLLRIDARLVAPFLRWLSGSRPGRLMLLYLDLAYLLCYPMIPLSVAALYLSHLRAYVDRFWVVVLVSTYVSYAMLPFLQTLPPRMLDEPWLKALPPTPLRRFNLWILQHGSIHANTFPSAHVASSTAAALVLGKIAPVSVAVVFAAIAAGITFGTFAGRYHYLADAVLGCAIALVVFAVLQG